MSDQCLVGAHRSCLLAAFGFACRCYCHTLRRESALRLVTPQAVPSLGSFTSSEGRTPPLAHLPHHASRQTEHSADSPRGGRREAS